jgi:succinate dehydrogenase/fumarate reductase flavoprotein subunit
MSHKVKLNAEVVKADVLVVGGGIAGLMAAIHAGQKGARVIVAEKANTKRSGSGATGNDHFGCYYPDYHGDDPMVIVKEFKNSLVGGFEDEDMLLLFVKQSFKRVLDWDSWGINMRPTGKFEFIGHAYPGRPRIFLKYAGSNQKEVLTREAKKAGAVLMNHLPIVDVITDGNKVTGAVGIDVSKKSPELKVIQAPAVILATGSATRLYPPQGSPGQLFNTAFCPACTGAAQAIAWRSGAKLINMEFPNRHAGPKFLARCGKATWIGVYVDPHAKPVGPFVTKPNKELGDVTADFWGSVFTDKLKDGTGPVYIDCTKIEEKDIDYMLWGLKEEGNTAMLDYMDREGIDVRKHMVEFTQYEPHVIGRGVEINQAAESSLKGLYAAGDPVGNMRCDIAGAAVFGWISGGSAADYAGGAAATSDPSDSDTVKSRVDLYNRFLAKPHGSDWKEANMALQQIMRDYAGVEVRSETLLKAGLKYLGDLKRKALAELRAESAHDLARCQEALDLMDCGEVIMHAALERKETRAMHRRFDFPFTNPLLGEKFLTVRREKEEVTLEWRNRR